jgi:hypothetical protein
MTGWTDADFNGLILWVIITCSLPKPTVDTKCVVRKQVMLIKKVTILLMYGRWLDNDPA